MNLYRQKLTINLSGRPLLKDDTLQICLLKGLGTSLVKDCITWGLCWFVPCGLVPERNFTNTWIRFGSETNKWAVVSWFPIELLEPAIKKRKVRKAINLKCSVYKQFFVAKKNPTFLIKGEFNHMSLWCWPVISIIEDAGARGETTSLGLLEQQTRVQSHVWQLRKTLSNTQRYKAGCG